MPHFHLSVMGNNNMYLYFISLNWPSESSFTSFDMYAWGNASTPPDIQHPIDKSQESWASKHLAMLHESGSSSSNSSISISSLGLHL
jgi:hypothetical protein